MIMMRIYVGLCKKEQVNCVMKIILFVHLFVRWKWSVCGILFEHKVILLMWIKDSTRDPKKQLNSVSLFPFTTSAQFFYHETEINEICVMCVIWEYMFDVILIVWLTGSGISLERLAFSFQPADPVYGLYYFILRLYRMYILPLFFSH